MGQQIVHLDNLIDSIVTGNVNVAAAQQAIANVEDVSTTAIDTVNGIKEDVQETKEDVQALKDQVGQDKLYVSGVLSQVTEDKESTKDYRIAAKEYRDNALDYLQAASLKYDEFDDRYLGALGEDPQTDNDGNVIQEGAIYWNMVDKTLKVKPSTTTAWKPIASATGALIATNNLDDIVDVVEARSNLGVYAKEDTSNNDELDDRDTENRDVDNHTAGTINGLYTVEEKAYVDIDTMLDTSAQTLPQAINEIKEDFDPIAYGVKLIGSNVLISGCEVSINSGDSTKFDVSAGVFYTVDNYTDVSDPMYKMHEFAGVTGVTATFIGTGSTSYICFDATGALVQLDTLPSQGEDIRKYLMVGVAVHPDSTITSVSNSVNTTYIGLGATVAEFGQAVGRITSGNIYGPASTDMTISKSAGITFGVASNYKTDRKNPNYTIDAEINGVTFQYLYRSVSNGWTRIASQVDVVANKYDNGSGVLSDVVPSKWTIQKVYYASGSGSTVIEYGQEVYDNETLAIESIGIRSTETSPITDNLIFRGWVVLRGNCTDLSDSNSALFLSANKFGDTSAVSGGVGLTTVSLQQAYENSSEPELTTNSTLGAVTFKEGTGNATENVVEIRNNLGVEVASVTGEGRFTGKVSAEDTLVTPKDGLSSDTVQLALEKLTATIEW